MKLSTTNAVCVWPTERSQITGTPAGAICQVTARLGIW